MPRIVSGLRLLAIVTIITAAATAAQIASSSPEAAACGVERWSVQTLQDRPRLLPPQVTTIARLVRLPRPRSLPNRRLRFERRVFTVTAAVTYIGAEDDGDLHLVLWQLGTGYHLIAEAPAPACTAGATPYRRRQMRLARKAVRFCGRARVTGVAFWDFKHGQIGVAPNAIELHPILRFACAA